MVRSCALSSCSAARRCSRAECCASCTEEAEDRPWNPENMNSCRAHDDSSADANVDFNSWVGKLQ